MITVNDYVKKYIDTGFSVVPVEYMAKICKIKDWPNLRIKSDTVPEFFPNPPYNIGVILGTASGELVDVDLDCEEAVALAPHMLPGTGMIFGRESRPASHRLYKTEAPGKTCQFADPEGGMLVELRAEGCMTVFPGSVHESGEEIRFDEDGEPAEIEFDRLLVCVQRLAAASLLLPRWQQGNRHNLALAVAGIMLANHFDPDDARAFIDALVQASGDAEAEDRHFCVTSTVKRLEDSKPVAGKTRLAAIIGEPRTNRFMEWLGLRSRPVAAEFLQGEIVTRVYGGPVPESDVGNAERFAAYNRARARYCYQLKKWFVWDGCRWAVDADGEIDRLASETVRALAIEAADRNARESLSWATKSHDLKRLRNMVALAQSHCSVRSEAFDADPCKLNCSSGIVDLTTGKLRPHNPEALMRKVAPVSFDPGAECPNFMAFLDRIFSRDANLIDFVQRAIGYSLTGRTDEQCLFVLVGNGANGKSTLIRVIQELLGDYAQQTPMETLMVGKSGGVGNDIARLEGARFVAAAEAEPGQRIAEAKIKQLTGGDRLAARYLYAEHFEFVPQFKLWLATNRLPEVRGTDDGIWRRFRIVPFNVTIPEAERDTALADKLRAELPGILNWAIAGCLEWQSGGLRPPQSVTDATKAYRADMDLVMQFIEDCCVPDSKAEETAKALYRSYAEWCNANGEQAMVQRIFGQRLQQLRYDERRTGKARKRRGLRLKTDNEYVEHALSIKASPALVPMAADDSLIEELVVELAD